MSKVCISVITVCYNAENLIENTIRSVLDQDYTDFEYIIKDGASSDNTLKIVNNYADSFKKKGINLIIVSAKDSGIYDAMNESLQYANGEWVIFINAGDNIYRSNVLKEISSCLNDEYSVVYGDVMLLQNGFCKLLESGKIEEINKTNPICHQGAFVKLNIAKKYCFDLGYSISADFDMFLRIYLDSPDSFKHINKVISYYLLGGVSSNKVLIRELEFNSSRKKNGLKRTVFPGLLILKALMIEKTRMIMIFILGKKFFSKNRGWNKY